MQPRENLRKLEDISLILIHFLRSSISCSRPGPCRYNIASCDAVTPNRLHMIVFNGIQVISDPMDDPVDPCERSFEPDDLTEVGPSTTEHGGEDEKL